MPCQILDICAATPAVGAAAALARKTLPRVSKVGADVCAAPPAGFNGKQRSAYLTPILCPQTIAKTSHGAFGPCRNAGVPTRSFEVFVDAERERERERERLPHSVRLCLFA